jgi:hypothetical protein
MDLERVNQAIRDCLQLCRGKGDVLPVIAGFMAGLKAAGQWRHEEIRAVDVGVLKVLQGIMAGAVYPGDATNQPPGDAPRGGSETTKVSGA